MRIYLFTFLFILSAPFIALASWADCDSADIISVSGYALVDTQSHHSRYFLDEDGDQLADYKLNFGPWWYNPDSSSAARPQNGQYIEIEGQLTCDPDDSLEVIKVFYIDGEFWRDPYDPSWNSIGKFKHPKKWHYKNHYGFAFGWLNDSLVFAKASGQALVDSTCKIVQYYLDTNRDTIPDYRLNFGPPWYKPDNGPEKPKMLEDITVNGILFDRKDMPIIFVLELNGEAWIYTTGFGDQLGGKWIYRYMKQYRRIIAMHDSLNRFRIGNGWFPKDKDQPNIPDSVFCRMLELIPENVPYIHKEKIAAAFEIGVFTPQGRNVMMYKDSIGGQLHFSSPVQFRLHYNNRQLATQNVNENKLQLKVWNKNTNDWQTMEDAVFNYDLNTVEFETNVIPGLIILSAEGTSAISGTAGEIPDKIALSQNYPNPFNNSTVIDYQLPVDGEVELTVYNLLGQKVAVLVSGMHKAGSHQIKFDASRLSSGIYLYKIKAGSYSEIKRMLLIK
ncbi:MAG: T9SS type A sorting domain-containing protein [Calditrichaceae bacterium]|nr:T9SS type A sorting domain-containing protein [Calditrichaceae bacterium]RQV97390.1 MAG: T9SS C-terminal target domain-containing protein [Calditrichota bacterium]